MNKKELISEQDWEKADLVFEELEAPIKVGMKIDQFSKLFGQ